MNYKYVFIDFVSLIGTNRKKVVKLTNSFFVVEGTTLVGERIDDLKR
jgi:hypothetical protein